LLIGGIGFAMSPGTLEGYAEIVLSYCVFQFQFISPLLQHPHQTKRDLVLA
jgi:hypothetical protein